MIKLFEKGIAEYNKEIDEIGPAYRYTADRYTIRKVEEITKWNQEVLLFHVDAYYNDAYGEPTTFVEVYTAFTTPEFIYEVNRISHSQDTFIKDTIRLMYDNIRFL